MRYLRHMEARCYHGSEGRTKMKPLKEIDLLLLDIEMPEMDGFDTLSQIRGFSDVKVAFITATRDYDTIEKAREMGVEDYITKPFLPAVFLETIHGIIEL